MPNRSNMSIQPVPTASRRQHHHQLKKQWIYGEVFQRSFDHRMAEKEFLSHFTFHLFQNSISRLMMHRPHHVPARWKRNSKSALWSQWRSSKSEFRTANHWHKDRQCETKEEYFEKDAQRLEIPWKVFSTNISSFRTEILDTLQEEKNRWPY